MSAASHDMSTPDSLPSDHLEGDKQQSPAQVRESPRGSRQALRPSCGGSVLEALGLCADQSGARGRLCRPLHREALCTGFQIAVSRV